MKKILVAIAITVLGSSAAFAATSITGSKHNLSSGASTSGITSNTSQICAFCHTPHNAAPAVPLWNRSAATSTYMLYTSSATLTSATKASTLGAKSISLLCLSCHDGTLLELGSRITNLPADAAAGVTTVEQTTGSGTWDTRGANLGADLTNDHPIGFNYATAQGADTAIRALGTAKTNGMQFFGAGADEMECASCHLVHDNTFPPFLRTTNSGSTLCLGCHIK